MNSRFICMPEPVKGESTFGFLLRFANANGYTGLHAFKWPVRLMVRSVDLRLLSLMDMAEITGHHYELLRVRLGMSYEPERDAYRYPFEALPCLVKKDGYNLASPRICPCCLQEQQHLRLVWELPLMIACDDHKILLQDQCPQCGEYLSWKRRHYDRCDCGLPLTQWQIEASDDRLLEFQWLVFRYRTNRGHVQKLWLRKLSPHFFYLQIDLLSRAVCRFVHYSLLQVDRREASRELSTYCLRVSDTTVGVRALLAFLRAEPVFCLQMLHLIAPSKLQAIPTRGRKKNASAALPLAKFRSQALEAVDRVFVISGIDDEGAPC